MEIYGILKFLKELIPYISVITPPKSQHIFEKSQPYTRQKYDELI